MKMNKDALKWVIYVGLFLVPFIPFLVYSGFFFPFITTKAFAWRIIVQTVFATWIILTLIDESYRPKKSLVLYAIGAFLVAIGLADLFGMAPAKSFWSNFERMEGYIALLHLGAYFLVIGSVFREVDWKRWWNTSLGVSAGVVLYSLVDVFVRGEERVDATFGNPTYLAVYMLLHVFIAALFLYRERANSVLKWLYGLLIALQVVIIYYTGTRGSILGLLAGLLVAGVLITLNKEQRYARKIGAGLLVSIVVIVGGFYALRNTEFVQESAVLSRFSSLDMQEIRSQGRYFVWPMAFEGFKDRPILGWGQENFNYVFQDYYQPEMYRLEPWFDRAHNIFLDWAVAGGALGLTTYLLLYLGLIVLIKRDVHLSRMEKSILFGLIAAYFVHNLFVFDHLISYILFFSLLAYVHTRSDGAVVSDKTISDNAINVLTPVVLVGLVLSLYCTNIRPMTANTNLIISMASLQTPSAGVDNAIEYLQKAYAGSRLGRPEIVEQIAFNSMTVLSADIPMEKKNEYFEFARGAVVTQAEAMPTDARYQLVAGSFLSSLATLDEALVYLDRARELMPNKQHIYFEAGSALVNAGEVERALEVFRYAYELVPEYRDAKIIYLVGAIYANNQTVENSLLSEFAEDELVMEDRLISAYYRSGRISDVRRILERRIELDPANESMYRQYIEEVSSSN